MSQFGQLLVFSLIFATYQFTKSEDAPDPTELDTVDFDFRLGNGSFIVKISMEKAECTDDRIKSTTKTPIPSGLNKPEAGEPLLGSSNKNPAESCYQAEFLRKCYIKTSTDPIKVLCDEKSRTTCLDVQEKIDEEAIMSSALTLGEQLWLSETTFDMKSLFNEVDGPTGTDILQISYLLSTSVKVSQTIRYYYSEGNATTAEDTNVKSLKALLWNDQSVGSEITKQMPIAFRVGETESCWEENTKGWMCTEIHFDATYTNRLPVRDFYIQDIRKNETVQRLYFELVSLCFHSK